MEKSRSPAPVPLSAVRVPLCPYSRERKPNPPLLHRDAADTGRMFRPGWQPLLLIAGVQDVIAPPGNSLLIAEQVPQAWLVRIRGGGHGLMYQYPDDLAALVLTFLAHGT